jgi:fructuronate reductase
MLTRKALNADSVRPPFAINEVEVGQVHLGLGGFHRAHQAAYTNAVLALDQRWGISAYTWSNQQLPRAMSAQDGLFCLVTAEEPASLQVIGAVRRSGCVATDAQRFVAEVASPTTHVITLTVTEKAHPLDQNTGQLDTSHAAVVSDLATDQPFNSVPGLLTWALHERARAGAGPLAVVSCDNLRDNGGVVERLVTGFAAAHRQYRPRGLASWITDHITFPRTVVDRIVPAPDAALTERVHALTGWHDAAAVMAEPYKQWVIEDRFNGPRPAWECAGATIVTDVEPYEQLKLRVLNAAHTALAYSGLLMGHRTVRDAISDPYIQRRVRLLLDIEILPHLPALEATDGAAYAETVLERFTNPTVAYSLQKLGADGSRKLSERLGPTAAAVHAAGAVAQHTAAVVATWIRWIAHCADTGAALDDPHSAPLLALAHSTNDIGDLAARVLASTPVLPASITSDTRFCDSVIRQARVGTP